MSAAEVRMAVNQSLTLGDAWPPSLPEFITKGELIDIDYDAAFSRMIRGKPNGDIEYWASQEVGFSCRRHLEESKARAKHKRAIKKYIEKAKAGTLPARYLMQVEDKSKAIPVEQLNRPDPSQFASNSVFARVAALGKRV